MRKLISVFLISIFISLFISCESNPGANKEDDTIRVHSSELSDILAGLDVNTEDNPYKVIVFEPVCEEIKEALNLNYMKFINLSFEDCEGFTEIKEKAFQGCKNLVNIEIPYGVVDIGNSAFEGCTFLKSIKIPEGVISVGKSAFSSCPGLEKLKIPDSVTSIGEGAFSGSPNLKTVILSKNMKTLKQSLFNCCSCLEEIVLPEKLEIIEKRVFVNCYNLRSIIIPETLTTIYDENSYSQHQSTFGGCYSLNDIYFRGTEEQWNKIRKSTGWFRAFPNGYKIHFNYKD
jgi:hypothetical protein